SDRCSHLHQRRRYHQSRYPYRHLRRTRRDQEITMTDDERQRLERLLPNLQRRAFIYQTIRTFFNEQGFLEVETPIRSPAIAPEKEIIPVESEGWFLSTSPELYMKRLLAAGYDK